MNTENAPQTLDALEARAWLDVYKAAPAEYAARAGLDLVETPDGIGLALRDVPTGLLNRFRLTADPAPISAASVQRALAWLGRHANAVQVIDAIAPPGSGAHGLIEAAGLPLAGRLAKFWRGTAPLPPTTDCSLTIREAGPAEGMDFARVAQVSFGMPDSLLGWFSALPGRPNWRIYVAYDGAAPAATGAMHVTGDTAWLGWGATVPEFRNRGGQNALLARRLQDGMAAGVRLFTIETGQPADGEPPGGSYRNIERAGFVFSHTRHSFKRG